MPSAAPCVVSPFEGKLLRVLRCFLGHVPLDQALVHVLERSPRPPHLSRAAVDLIQDSLAKGCMLCIVRSGGWRRERFVHNGLARDGRLWDRWPANERRFAFSRNSLEFLIWITAQNPGDTEPPLTLPDAELTPADRLLLFLAYDALRDTEAATFLRQRPAFANHGLCRLAFPEDCSGAAAEPDFRPWMHGLGAAILEAMQPWLADRWLHLERSKAHIGDWHALAALGRAQERVLASFTDAIQRANRPDLVRFLLQVCRRLLTTETTARSFFAGLQGTGPARLAERLEVQRRALAVPRHLEQLQAWERRARTVGFLDEGYAVSQLWKADWERLHGDELTARAQALIRQVEPLKVR